MDPPEERQDDWDPAVSDDVLTFFTACFRTYNPKISTRHIKYLKTVLLSYITQYSDLHVGSIA